MSNSISLGSLVLLIAEALASLTVRAPSTLAISYQVLLCYPIALFLGFWNECTLCLVPTTFETYRMFTRGDRWLTWLRLAKTDKVILLPGMGQPKTGVWVCELLVSATVIEFSLSISQLLVLRGVCTTCDLRSLQGLPSQVALFQLCFQPRRHHAI
jgi:hypothetical protein